MPTLIDGKATATQIKAEIAQQVEALIAAGGKRPHLAAILVGNDGGSETYVRNKVLACESCGFESTLIRFDDTIAKLSHEEFFLSESTTLRIVRRMLLEGATVGGQAVKKSRHVGFRSSAARREPCGQLSLFPE